MPVRISASAQNACADAINTLANAGSGAAVVKIYTGTQPATPASAATGTLLVSWALSDPAFGSASGGTITALTMPKNANAATSGVAGYGRLEDSSGNGILDGEVGTSGTTFVVSSTTIVSGAPYTLSAVTVTVPGA